MSIYSIDRFGYFFLWVGSFTLSFAGVDLSTQKIHEDFLEPHKHNIHSTGLLSYGSHSNTFHLRNFHLRYNLELESTQFFLTLQGSKDTHDPEVNYPFHLPNISLYDFGVAIRLWNRLVISPRAAATFRQDLTTFLLLAPYYSPGNDGEFDFPASYQPLWGTGPGIRLLYEGEGFALGFSQGDFRHVIPTALLWKLYGEGWYLRWAIYSEYGDPLVFRRELHRYTGQLSYQQRFELGNGWGLSLLPEITYVQLGTWWIRLEEAIQISGFTWGLREIIKTGEKPLLETSLTKGVEEIAQLGVHYSSNGYIYLGCRIGF